MKAAHPWGGVLRWAGRRLRFGQHLPQNKRCDGFDIGVRGNDSGNTGIVLHRTVDFEHLYRVVGNEPKCAN